MFKEANSLFEQQQKSGERSKRQLGWFALDIVKYPEIALPGLGPNQLMTTAGYTQSLNVKKIGDPLSTPAEFAEKVNQMSGDWVEEISCDDLKEAKTYLAYFGSSDLPKHDKLIEDLSNASQNERYKFTFETVPFYHVNDAECSKEFGNNPNLKTLYLKTEKYDKPFVFEESEGAAMDPSDITRFLNQSLTLTDPFWNRRSSAGIMDSAISGLFYVAKRLEEPGSEEYDSQFKKWNLKTFLSLVDAQKDAAHIDFLPIIVGYENQK